LRNFSLKAAKDFIKLELVAAGQADSTLVTRDIAARKHEAAAGEMWIALRAELVERKIDAEIWCRRNLGVSLRSMEHRAFLHRHWDIFLAARKQGIHEQHGLVHAMALIRHRLNIAKAERKPFHLIAPSHWSVARIADPHSAVVKPNLPVAPIALSKAVTLWQAGFDAALPLVPQNSVDLAIVDPPYFIRRSDWTTADYYLAKNGKKPRFDAVWDKFDSIGDYKGFSETWINGVLRTLKDTGSMFISGTFHNIGIINYVLQEMGVPIIGDIIWLKRSARPSLSTRRLRSTHETILWVAKCEKYRFNYYDVRDAAYAGDPLKKVDTQLGSVWTIEPVTKFPPEVTGHPAQKPLALYRRMLDMCGVEGGVVLDPMAGSGTTAVAAVLRGMKAILIEHDPAYCDLIKKRIAAESRTSVVAGDR
jgi:site-specific DNA-methyltransferase (adenine-specific)